MSRRTLTPLNTTASLMTSSIDDQYLKIQLVLLLWTMLLSLKILKGIEFKNSKLLYSGYILVFFWLVCHELCPLIQTHIYNMNVKQPQKCSCKKDLNVKACPGTHLVTEVPLKLLFTRGR